MMRRIADLKILNTAGIPLAVAKIIIGYLPGAQIFLFWLAGQKTG